MFSYVEIHGKKLIIIEYTYFSIQHEFVDNLNNKLEYHAYKIGQHFSDLLFTGNSNWVHWNRWENVITSLLTLLTFVNSCLNPIFYAFMSK